MPAEFQSATFTPDSPFKAGDVITFSVKFTEAVTGNGGEVLVLTGGRETDTVGASGGGFNTDTLLFDYTVQP